MHTYVQTYMSPFLLKLCIFCLKEDECKNYTDMRMEVGTGSSLSIMVLYIHVILAATAFGGNNTLVDLIGRDRSQSNNLKHKSPLQFAPTAHIGRNTGMTNISGQQAHSQKKNQAGLLEISTVRGRQADITNDRSDMLNGRAKGQEQNLGMKTVDVARQHAGKEAATGMKRARNDIEIEDDDIPTIQLMVPGLTGNDDSVETNDSIHTTSNDERVKRSVHRCTIRSRSTCPWTYDENQEAVCLTPQPIGCDPELCLTVCRRYRVFGVAVACIATRPCIQDAGSGPVAPCK